MNPRDVFKPKEDGLEDKLPKYEEELKIPLKIHGITYEIKIKEYECLMQILKESGTKLEDVKKYDPKNNQKYFGIRIENYSITKLQMNHYQLQKMPYLKELSQLQTLNLRKNFIKKIEELDYLNKLEFINLNFNRIHEIEGLEKLSKLKKILLVGNFIIRDEENNKAIKKLIKNEVNILV